MREQHILPYLCPLLMSWIFPEYGNKLANEAANGLPRDNFNFFGNDISSDACSWEVRVSEMPDRIPSKITEIYCKNHGSACHRSSLYEVTQQLKRLFKSSSANNIKSVFLVPATDNTNECGLLSDRQRHYPRQSSVWHRRDCP